MTRLGAFLSVSRLEYLGAGIFFLVAVAALGAGTYQRLQVQLPWVALGCLLWLFCHLLGSHVNCLADYESDKGRKAVLPQAVDAIGRRILWSAIVAESVLALAIAVLFSLRQASATPVALFALGWILTMAYSLEPFRFKRRGFLSPISLSLVLYGLPVALGYAALTSSARPSVLVLLFGVGLQMFGVITMNSFGDMPEDRQAQIATPFVRHGPRFAAAVALLSYAVGASLAAWSLFPLLRSLTAQLALASLSALAHGWVISTIAPVLAVKHDADERIHTLGTLNSVQFGVLGMMFGAQSLAVLLGA